MRTRITDEMVVIRNPSAHGADQYGQVIVKIEGDAVKENNVDQVVSVVAVNPINNRPVGLTDAERRIANRLLLAQSIGIKPKGKARRIH